MPAEWLILAFLFALGACVGSFLNVVVYRLPLGMSLVSPPSRCPRCETKLAWHDNVPVLGWIWLRGRCRHCRAPISPRYPIVEAITGMLFGLTYLALFQWGYGPCGAGVQELNALGIAEVVYPPMSLDEDAILLAVYLYMISSLLAASLIDAEHFVIPVWLCWLMAIVGVVGHALGDRVGGPGNLVATLPGSAAAVGSGVGLLISIALLRIGWLKRSFADAMPMLEHEREVLQKQAEQARAEGREPEPIDEPHFPPSRIRAEMRHEMVFLMPPMLLGAIAVLLVWRVPSAGEAWAQLTEPVWLRAALGALLGGFVGGLVVWLTRILGSIAFGREAMGLGDVHLMFGVGAILGGLHVTVAFFIAPFFGLLLALYMLVTRKRRELPYGPYLALGSVATLALYCRVQHYPGLHGLAMFVESLVGGSAP